MFHLKRIRFLFGLSVVCEKYKYQIFFKNERSIKESLVKLEEINIFKKDVVELDSPKTKTTEKTVPCVCWSIWGDHRNGMESYWTHDQHSVWETPKYNMYIEKTCWNKRFLVSSKRMLFRLPMEGNCEPFIQMMICTDKTWLNAVNDAVQSKDVEQKTKPRITKIINWSQKKSLAFFAKLSYCTQVHPSL